MNNTRIASSGNIFLEALRFGTTWWKTPNDPNIVIFLTTRKQFLNSSITPALIQFDFLFFRTDINEHIEFLQENCLWPLQFVTKINDFPTSYLKRPVFQDFLSTLLDKTDYFKKQLRFYTTREYTDENLLSKILYRQTNLETLDISACFELDGTRTFFDEENMKKLGRTLRYFRLCQLPVILINQWKKFNWHCLTNLRKVVCTQLPTVSDEFLSELRHAKHLEAIHLFMCNKVTGSFFESLEMNCLADIELSGLPIFNDEGLALIGKRFPRSLANFRLQACKQVTDDGFAKCFQPLVFLQKLHLNNCTKLTADTGRILADSGAVMSTLRSLTLTFFPTTNGNEFLSLLTKEAKEIPSSRTTLALEELYIINCLSITGHVGVMENLVHLKNSSLKKLYIHGLEQDRDVLTDDDEKELKKWFPQVVVK